MIHITTVMKPSRKHQARNITSNVCARHRRCINDSCCGPLPGSHCHLCGCTQSESGPLQVAPAPRGHLHHALCSPLGSWLGATHRAACDLDHSRDLPSCYATRKCPHDDDHHGVVLVLSYGIVHGLGHVTMWIYRGVNYCTFVPRAEPVFIIVDEIEGFIISVLTVFLIGRLCKTRCRGEGKYPMDKVIPVIVGNVLYMFAVGMKAPMNDIVLWLYLVIVIIVLLVWLLGESDLRQPLQETCCPCCSSMEDEENEPILLEWCGVLEVN